MSIKQETITLLLEKLSKHISNYHIILEKTDVIGKVATTNEKGQQILIDGIIGTVVISISIEDFITIYQDDLENDSIPVGNKLQTMKDRKFYDSVFKEIDKGYVKYIEQWIDEGINL